ncbi:hypothetical protein C5167_020514 [Papaver somniferum]|uniref:ATP-dependent DNA helicase n=1 Tax=Papaver somniferum TaxID=3469 RepID=A0A4Y7IX85_PAPSO|nr:hypothetical protein C5167_020514 [Papaver somniferum]
MKFCGLYKSPDFQRQSTLNHHIFPLLKFSAAVIPDYDSRVTETIKVGDDPEPKIRLSPSMKRCENLKDLISTVYPGIEEMSIPTASYMTQRTILCPRNDDVTVINQLIL